MGFLSCFVTIFALLLCLVDFVWHNDHPVEVDVAGCFGLPCLLRICCPPCFVYSPSLWHFLALCYMALLGHQGQDVQSVVSLTSSLRVISLTVLSNLIYNILIFCAEKM